MEYFRFEVRLLDAAPAPWRQFLIAKKATFENLHLAIQCACDWENCHLFAFHADRRGPVLAGSPDDESDPPPPDAARVKLASFFLRGGPDRCFYWYDFGDDWWHEVRLIEVGRLQERFLAALRKRSPVPGSGEKAGCDSRARR